MKKNRAFILTTVKVVILTLFAFLLTNCNSRLKEEVKTSFLQLKSAIQKMEIEKIAASLDQESIDYLQHLSDISSEDNYEAAASYGRSKGYELSTMILFESFKNIQLRKERDTIENDKFDTNRTILIAGSYGIGMLRFGDVSRIKFNKIEEISEKQATVLVEVATGSGNHYILSKYIFNRENESWKLNLISTFRLQESLLIQQFRKAGKDKDRFIKDIVNRQPTEVEFMYRKN